MIIALIIIIVCLIISIIFNIFIIKNTKTLNKEILQKEQEIQNTISNLQKEKDSLNLEITNGKQIIINLENNKNHLLTQIKELNEVKEETERTLQENAKKSFENYCDLLEYQFQEKEKIFDDNVFELNTKFNIITQDIENKIKNEEHILQGIIDTRTAAIKAQQREKEIKEKISFYCIRPTDKELSDIKKLEAIKLELNNPRILSMLIWSIYFQKSMTILCNNVLGVNTVCGIYKITNQTNNMCYIGQSVNVANRWKEHAKCGLGIDTPPGNKLYKAMIEDGLWNFSFELLETCSKENLNEKEKYYIALYQSKEYGYNTLKGVGE